MAVFRLRDSRSKGLLGLGTPGRVFRVKNSEI